MSSKILVNSILRKAFGCEILENRPKTLDQVEVNLITQNNEYGFVICLRSYDKIDLQNRC